MVDENNLGISLDKKTFMHWLAMPTSAMAQNDFAKQMFHSGTLQKPSCLILPILSWQIKVISDLDISLFCLGSSVTIANQTIDQTIINEPVQ